MEKRFCFLFSVLGVIMMVAFAGHSAPLQLSLVTGDAVSADGIKLPPTYVNHAPQKRATKKQLPFVIGGQRVEVSDFRAPASVEEVKLTAGASFGMSDGIYELSTSQATLTRLASVSQDYYGQGLYDCGDYFYAQSLDEYAGFILAYGSYHINPITWSVERLAGADLVRIIDGYYDSSTGLIMGYMWKYSDASMVAVDQWGWASLDPETGLCTMIKALTPSEIRFFGVMGNDEGKAWGITQDGAFYSINPATGDYTLIKAASAELKTDYTTSGCYDYVNNRILYAPAVGTDNTRMLSVDPVTGEATHLFTYNNDYEFVGMNMAPKKVGNAPATGSDLKVEFEGVSLSGKLTVKAPETFNDGTSGSGTLSYRVTVDDGKPLEGECQWDAIVTVDVAVETSGSHLFTVKFFNTNGESGAIGTTRYVGRDVPGSPSDVVVEYAAGVFTVTWAAVPTMGANGNPVDPQEVSYRVTFSEEPEKPCETEPGVTEMTWTLDEEPESGFFSFTVTAFTAEFTGGTATSNTIVMGGIEPPYSNSISTQAEFDELFAWSPHGTDNQFIFYQGWAVAPQNMKSAQDSYLATPGIRFEEGKTYTFEVMTACRNASYPERVEVLATTGLDLEQLTTGITMIEPTMVTWTEGKVISGTFTAPSTGVYFMVVHDISDRDMYWFYVKDIKVSAAYSADMPVEPDDLKVEADPSGELKATISFTTPTINVESTALKGEVKARITKDGTEVADIACGSPVTTWTDSDVTAGRHTYGVVVYNEYGQAAEVTATCFVGFDIPMNVDEESITLKEDPEGTAVITWAAVTEDIQGKTLPEVKYNVYVARTGEIVVNGTTETTVSVVAVEEGEQDFRQWAIEAVTEAGKSATPAYTTFEPFGVPLVAPVLESGADNLPLAIDYLNTMGAYAEVGVTMASELNGVDAYGDDDYLFFFTIDEWYASFGMPSISVTTGKIRIPEEMTGATIGFDYFCIDPSSQDGYELYIREYGSDERFKRLGRVEASGAMEWKSMTAVVKDYAGKVVQIAIHMEMFSTYTMLFDNIRVYNDESLGIPTVNLPEAEGPASYYDVMGRKVKNPEKGQFYIVVRGERATKEVF